MSVIYYAIPVPIGLVVFLLAFCLRVMLRQSQINDQRRCTRVVRRTVIIPRQFESPRAPIVTEGGMNADDPPPYSEATQVQPGAYARVMAGYNQAPNSNFGLPKNVSPYAYPPPSSSQLPSGATSAAQQQGVILNASSLPNPDIKK